jgi:hypothetical protein
MCLALTVTLNLNSETVHHPVLHHFTVLLGANHVCVGGYFLAVSSKSVVNCFAHIRIFVTYHQYGMLTHYSTIYYICTVFRHYEYSQKSPLYRTLGDVMFR